ncbi:hypothetical protein OAS86_06925 [Gammaproteobacteria bacterium]|nr:hypothetical protein [Gammaproteobacteria bacterium]
MRTFAVVALLRRGVMPLAAIGVCLAGQADVQILDRSLLSSPGHTSPTATLQVASGAQNSSAVLNVTRTLSGVSSTLLRVEGEGHVGIGTDSPSAELDVDSGVSGNSGLRLVQLPGTTAVVATPIGVDFEGNVGIATTGMVSKVEPIDASASHSGVVTPDGRWRAGWRSVDGRSVPTLTALLADRSVFVNTQVQSSGHPNTARYVNEGFVRQRSFTATQNTVSDVIDITADYATNTMLYAAMSWFTPDGSAYEAQYLRHSNFGGDSDIAVIVDQLAVP